MALTYADMPLAVARDYVINILSARMALTCADMAELADALDLGSSGYPPWRFKSSYPHQQTSAEYTPNPQNSIANYFFYPKKPKIFGDAQVFPWCIQNFYFFSAKIPSEDFLFIRGSGYKLKSYLMVV